MRQCPLLVLLTWPGGLQGLLSLVFSRPVSFPQPANPGIQQLGPPGWDLGAVLPPCGFRTPREENGLQSAPVLHS